MHSPIAVLEQWNFRATEATTSVVLPDGCQDLIVRIDADGAANYFVSALADQAYSVESHADEVFVGYRFQPGATIDETGLLAALKSCNATDLGFVVNLIDNFVVLDSAITEALTALATCARVKIAARYCGVSERSLERLIAKRTGRAPSYWKCLARARQAARTLATADIHPSEHHHSAASLADIAAQHGYADQAHLHREFQRWFATTPIKLKQDATLLRTLVASGYGDCS
jgi:AraC-like DNA-binding protein